MNIYFYQVGPTELNEYWPKVEGRLQKACDVTGFFDTSDIYHDLIDKRLMLVVGVDENYNIVGEAIYRRVIYPKKKSLVLVISSAISFKEFFPHIYEYSFDLLAQIRFDVLEVLCRPAVARMLRKKGHKPYYWMIAHGRR